jgi:hypothetical protein
MWTVAGIALYVNKQGAVHVWQGLEEKRGQYL